MVAENDTNRDSAYTLAHTPVVAAILALCARSFVGPSLDAEISGVVARELENAYRAGQSTALRSSCLTCGSQLIACAPCGDRDRAMLRGALEVLRAIDQTQGKARAIIDEQLARERRQ